MPEIILSDKTIEYRRQKGPNYRILAKFLNDIMDRSRVEYERKKTKLFNNLFDWLNHYMQQLSFE